MQKMQYIMKRALMLSLACLLLVPASFAGGRNKKKASDGAMAEAASPANENEIHWMNIDDVQVAMKKEPRKVWIDVYTDWCGWCKRMDKTTFSNPNVVKYVNEHFYAVKLNAEQREDIRFMGKMYKADPADRTHPFAKEILHDQLSYPTTVFMEENFQHPMAIPGYQDVPTIEAILKYLGENTYKTTPWPQFQANFKPSWAVQ
jgi:thioredoxin-related protein